MAAEHFEKRGDDLPTDAIFDKSSFWYKPIPIDAPLHEKSERFVADFNRQVKTYYGNVNLATYSYASPVYTVDRDTPTVTVEQWMCSKKGFRSRELAEGWQAVPIPPGAKPAQGTDSEMTIYQPSTDSLWEFWRTRQVDGQWQACWGGRMKNVSRSNGIWQGHYGTTATSLPFLGGQITAEELRRGEIRHVMGIALVDVEKYAVVSWPAQRSDGYNPKDVPDRIPEGLRFRLDPTIDVDSLRLHPVAKTIARAAQKYGFVVWDKGGAVVLRMQNPMSYRQRGETDPYRELFAGTPSNFILKDFPWDRLQFLPKDYGRP